MFSIAEEDQLFGALVLSEANKVEESGLSEAIDRDVSHPDEELLPSLIVNAREAPAGLLPRKANLRLNIEVLRLSLFALKKRHHCQAEVYLN
jgi:hypothetical protein